MKKCELLAPAGSIESLYAAVLSGADAVYLGGNKFSARAYASNFDNDTLVKVVDYCHIYGVKVYITLNTLIKEDEIIEAVDYIKFLYKIGIDALIIQDTGITYIINKIFPDLEIHASTQMTIHNGEAAEFLVNLGFKRIVLSRELSIKEIKSISIDRNIETEVFVHGALCICYSGQCLMSSMIGGRSGNRGRCAQPCRLPYKIIRKDTGEERQGYILSPKDICTVENLKDIIDSGTSSLKIEGRMKRPEYVAGVVSSYRKSIDNIYGLSSGFDVDSERLKLMKLFNREGFSKAYLYGNTGREMMAYSYPKNTGILIGEVLKDLTVILKDDVQLDDGIRSGDKGFTLSKIVKAGKEVSEAYKGDRVKLYPISFETGDFLYKTSDIKLMEELSGVYSNPYSKKITLDIAVKFEVDSKITLQTEYKGKKFQIEGEMVQSAVNRPLDKNRIEENLRKTGDSPFTIKNIKYVTFNDGFVPISAINSVRRGLLEKIFNEKVGKYKRDYPYSSEEVLGKLGIVCEEDKELKKLKKSNDVEYLITINSLEQARAAEDLGLENIALDLYKRGKEININDIRCKNIYLKIPNIIKEEFEAICSMIEKYLPHVKGIVTANLGVINRFKGKTKIIGDYKLNIFNSYSAKFFNDFIQRIPLSVELNKKEIIQTVNALHSSGLNNIRMQQLLYGKVELMVSEYCPVGSTMGGKDRKSRCNRICENDKYVLKDRKNEEFIIINDKFCRSYIYNSAATNLIPVIEEFIEIGVDSFRLDFIDEDYGETYKVLSTLLNRNSSILKGNYTKGHYKRGVE